MAVSNAVGSNIFDILVCMGLPWLLKSMAVGGPVEIYSQGESDKKGRGSSSTSSSRSSLPPQQPN